MGFASIAKNIALCPDYRDAQSNKTYAFLQKKEVVEIRMFTTFCFSIDSKGKIDPLTDK
jgi:hypothetical protein